MKIFISLIGLFLSQISFSQSEQDIATLINENLCGILEYVTSDGCRIDLLTSTHAYEIDYASKWKESIGQAMWYAIQSNKKAGIILLLETDKDFLYAQKLISTISHSNLSNVIDVKLFPNDFPEISSLELPSYSKTSVKSEYWITLNSNRRHNNECRWFEKSRGHYCQIYEGKAAACCGG